jgi:hypothetical protein
MTDNPVDLCACGIPWDDVPPGHHRAISMLTGKWTCGGTSLPVTWVPMHTKRSWIVKGDQDQPGDG